MSLTRSSLLLGAFALACGSSPDKPADPPGSPAPTYSELYASYFAAGTPGHCATAGCHADPGHTVWLCGSTKGDCYAGMVTVALIDPADPTHSSIADAHRSPLVWFNPSGGNMPFDAQVANNAGRDAIAAWVAAGAQDD
ncbi:MAG: hypothetical protein ABUL62_33495 [Myxococcales bacterium]